MLHLAKRESACASVNPRELCDHLVPNGSLISAIRIIPRMRIAMGDSPNADGSIMIPEPTFVWDQKTAG